jgi:ribosomal protein L16 Arg81 hydroxylase
MYIIKVIIPMLAILLASIFGCAIGNPSNQYAATKKVQSGWIKSDLSEKKVLRKGDKFHVPIGLRHRMYALEDTELFEFSTQHFDEDSYRLIQGDI